MFFFRAALLSFLFTILALAGCSKKAPPPSLPSPTPTATPIPLLPRKNYETARLFNGILLKSSLKSIPSEATALSLEADENSYELRLELHLQIPKAAITATNLLSASLDLETLLPNLDHLLTNAEVSPDFATLFSHKEKNLRANLTSLQRLLPRDTIYDCQTILNLENPESSRHALLIQALMDVDLDGSDGDRNFEIKKPSAFFQPQINYRWPKSTEHPNPYLPWIKDRIATIEIRLSDESSLTKNEKTELKERLSDARETLAELKRWSFLVGTADPFIVLPSFMFHNGEEHLEIGDYAVVIAHGILYPAIVGDKGPNFKMGEASLRICREIDPKSTADSRPIDHPSVVYLVFPNTAEKPFTSPNYQHWSERCHALWKEFGGNDTAPWKTWDSLEKPWPTPTPLPTPSATPTPSPTPMTSLPPQLTPTPARGTTTNSALSIPTTTGTNPAATPSPSPSPSPTSSLPSPSPSL